MYFVIFSVLFLYSLSATNKVDNAPNDVPIKIFSWNLQLYFFSS